MAMVGCKRNGNTRMIDDCKTGLCQIEIDVTTILCVLKTGGDYNKEYVDKLYQGVSNNLSYAYSFVCLTDDQRLLGFENLPYSVVPLENELDILTLNEKLYKERNYWAKIEVFRFTGKVLYFDLDTVIFNSIDNLIRNLPFDSNSFMMLKAFNKDRDFASGIMAWNGDFGFLFNQFKPKQHILEYEKWDQMYIRDFVKENGIKIEAIQNYLPGIYSYKHHCKNNISDDTSIVCFHGKPRPHEVGGVYWK